MGTYLNGQLVIADDLLVTGDVKLLGGGNIETVDNNDLTLLPHGTGITIIGDAGAPAHLSSPTNDDFFINGRMEIGSISFLLGTTAAAAIKGTSINWTNAFAGSAWGYSRTFADDGLHLAVSATDGELNNNLILCALANADADHNHDTPSANPTFWVHSGTAPGSDDTQWLSSAHDQTDGVIGVGKGDLVITCPANQTLRLTEPVYDDLRVPLTSGLIGASNPPALVKFKDDGSGSVGVYAWQFGDQAVAGNEEQMWFQAQLPHTYKEGSDIEAHVHWVTPVGGAADEFVKWGLEYAWKNIDGTFGNTTIITSDASAAATATTSGDASMAADKHYLTELGDITGTGMTISSMLVCRVFRNSSHADDDLAQAVFGLEIDFHHQIDTMGSRTETAK